MISRRRLALVAALATSLPCRQVLADPYAPKPGEILHLSTPSTGRTDGGTDLRLPPGYFLDEPTWGKLDVENKRLQNAETRLTAENKSLRTSASSISFGWKTLATALLVGVAAGAYVATR
jgi:hypothetical protein